MSTTLRRLLFGLIACLTLVGLTACEQPAPKVNLPQIRATAGYTYVTFLNGLFATDNAKLAELATGYDTAGVTIADGAANVSAAKQRDIVATTEAEIPALKKLSLPKATAAQKIVLYAALIALARQTSNADTKLVITVNTKQIKLNANQTVAKIPYAAVTVNANGSPLSASTATNKSIRLVRAASIWHVDGTALLTNAG